MTALYILAMLSMAMLLVWLSRLFVIWHTTTGKWWYAGVAVLCLLVGTIEVALTIVHGGMS
jgi:hypothetical protein